MTSFIHGGAVRGAHTTTYKSWRYMRDRIFNDPDYAGVVICDRWNAFENFLADMGNKPEGKTLDRIDNSKGYSPDNCRWATPIEQANNKTTNVFVSFSGTTLTIAQWATKLGIPYKTLYSRLYLYKWAIDKALTQPIRK